MGEKAENERRGYLRDVMCRMSEGGCLKWKVKRLDLIRSIADTNVEIREISFDEIANYNV